MGFRVEGLGFGDWGLGPLGFRVEGLGFGVWGLGLRVWGLGFRGSWYYFLATGTRKTLAGVCDPLGSLMLHRATFST